MSEMPSQETTGIVIPPFQPSNSTQTPEPDLSSLSEFAQGVLAPIDPAERPIVAKHVKTWDGAVTKKFQEIHDQYAPYKELGDIEAVQQAMYYSSLIQNDPVGFVQTLQQAIRDAGMSMDDLNTFEEEPNVPPTPGSIAPEIEQRFAQMEKLLQGAVSQITSFNEQQKEQQQLAQLDKIMADLHSAHGDFDDEWVLLQLEKPGVTPEKAIEAWQKNIIGKFGNQHKPAPVLPPTNGAVRHDQVDPSKLSPEDRKRYGAQILMANLRD